MDGRGGARPQIFWPRTAPAGSMKRSGVRPSVCLSVCPVDGHQQRCADGLLLSSGACSRHRSMAGTRRTRSNSKCGQRHVASRGTSLNTDVLEVHYYDAMLHVI